jgi:hypothetical protein
MSSEKNLAETSHMPLQNKTNPTPVINKRIVRLVKIFFSKSVYFITMTGFLDL